MVRLKHVSNRPSLFYSDNKLIINYNDIMVMFCFLLNDISNGDNDGNNTKIGGLLTAF